MMKTVRKAILWTAMITLVICLVGCEGKNDKGGAEGQTEEKNTASQEDKDGDALTEEEINEILLDHGQEVLDLMIEKIDCEAYVKLMGSSSLTNSEYYQKLKKMEYSKPLRIYKITLTEEFLNLVWAQMTSDAAEIQDLSENLQKELRSRLLGTIVTIFNQRMTSVESVAVGSLLNTGKSFVEKGMSSDPVMLLYIYEDAYPLVVSFNSNDEGVLGVSANVLFVEEIKSESESEIRTSISELFSGVSQFFAGASVKIEKIR